MKFTFFECPVSKALNCLGLFSEEEKEKHTVILTSLGQHQKDWDHVVPENHYLTSGFCLTSEKSYPKNISPLYAIVYRNNIPVFCAKFQNIRIIPENIRKHKRGEFVRITTNLVLNTYDLNLLVCGNVFKDGLAGFYYNTSFFNAEEANAALLKCIEKITKQDCFAGVILKDVPDGFGFRSDLKTFTFDDDISMILSVSPEWSCLEDYQKDLSKKYATRARKILASASEIQVKDLNLEEINRQSPQLYSLYQQVVQQQVFAFGMIKDNFFSEMKKKFPESYSVKGLYLHQVLCGFYSTFEQESELEVHYAGIDYKFNASHNLYFYIHFLALKEAIDKRKTRLNMGRTSLEAKAILGCKPRYNNTSIHFLNPIAEKAFYYFKEHLTESGNWKTRHPLKNSMAFETA